MKSIFGWSLPPGVSQRMIDEQAGVDGPYDCPICADGVELEASCPVCKQDMVCSKHGCVECQKLESKRKYCQGPFCGDYIRAGITPVERDGKIYCSEVCSESEKVAAQMYQEE